MTAPIPVVTSEDMALAVQLALVLRGDGLYRPEVRHLLETAVLEFDPRVIIAILANRLGDAYDEPTLRYCWDLATTEAAIEAESLT